MCWALGSGPGIWWGGESKEERACRMALAFGQWVWGGAFGGDFDRRRGLLMQHWGPPWWRDIEVTEGVSGSLTWGWGYRVPGRELWAAQLCVSSKVSWPQLAASCSCFLSAASLSHCPSVRFRAHILSTALKWTLSFLAIIRGGRASLCKGMVVV